MRMLLFEFFKNCKVTSGVSGLIARTFSCIEAWIGERSRSVFGNFPECVVDMRKLVCRER